MEDRLISISLSNLLWILEHGWLANEPQPLAFAFDMQHFLCMKLHICRQIPTLSMKGIVCNIVYVNMSASVLKNGTFMYVFLIILVAWKILYITWYYIFSIQIDNMWQRNCGWLSCYNFDKSLYYWQMLKVFIQVKKSTVKHALSLYLERQRQVRIQWTGLWYCQKSNWYAVYLRSVNNTPFIPLLHS